VWLAYAVAEYVKSTGDTAILDEPVAYLEGPRLADAEHDAFFEPRTSDERAPLYTHVVRALERCLAVGVHGLPLMGSGDWNDGMNLVGAGGKGESVWLGWFLQRVLNEFAPIAEARGDPATAERWRVHAALLAAAAEKNAWDGAWYRRAFFDNGAPLGSAENAECRIDSIAQSWAVISGGASADRSKAAMLEAERQLINRQDKLALLFTPPFDTSPVEPGYIKGYPPGLRENGGQYTHGAIWMIIAEAMQREGEKATSLWQMINPITRSASRDGAERYKVEPYVVAADIYSAVGQIGRGGWTWYTGSAGWLYRAGIEWILGLRKEGNSLRIDPCIPPSWPGFRANYRYGTTRYEISVDNPAGLTGRVGRIAIDGAEVLSTSVIPLVDDGRTHQISVLIGP
jgi:cyclic beta-1,2-glucan synthetase